MCITSDGAFGSHFFEVRTSSKYEGMSSMCGPLSTQLD